MAVPLITTISREQARVVNQVVPIPLPVNPLSWIMLTLQVTAGAVSPSLNELLGAFRNIEVLFKGTSIFSCNGVDLGRMQQALGGRPVPVFGFNNVAPNLIRFNLLIPFGRVPWWPEEAFPPTRSGELTLRLTYAAAFTNFTLPIETVTTGEILDAAPKRFLKVTTVFDQAVAIGDRAQVDLPIGNPILGVLLFGTTFPGAAMTSTIRRLTLKLDNVESQYSQVEHDPLLALPMYRLDFPVHYDPLDTDWAQHLYLDFDPMRDGSYALRTEGRAKVQLEFRADAADAVRVLPVELITLAGGA